MIDKFEVTSIEVMGPHFTKYHLSDGRVVHKFSTADSGDPHDHPFNFTTTILYGGYGEDIYHLFPSGNYCIDRQCRLPGTTHNVRASTVHLLTKLYGDECWTIVSPGPPEGIPGFYQFRPDGIWRRDWDKEFTLYIPKLSP